MALQSSDYLTVLKPLTGPHARLVCFPHSGGGPSAFAAWSDLLESHRIEVVAISLPGRERRVEEEPLTDWRKAVSAVCEALQESGLVDDVPYAFFGHSLGALLAYECARLLEELLVPGQPRPVHLFASGHGAPFTVRCDRDSPIPHWGRLHTLEDAALVKAVQAFGVLPASLLADQDLLQMVLRALRADFTIYETYDAAVPAGGEGGRGALGVPITALGGKNDKAIPIEHLDTWAAETKHTFLSPEVFPGDHFFVDTCRDEVVSHVVLHLKTALANLPPSVLGSAFQVPQVCTERLIQDVILDVAHEAGDAEALVDGARSGERVTYSELAKRVEFLAVKLHKDFLSGQAGKVVALLMAHDPTYVTCMLAIWKAAGVLIFVEAHYPPALCKEICEDSGVIAAVTNTEHSPKFKDVRDCTTLVLDKGWAAEVSGWVAEEAASLCVADLPRAGLQDISILAMTSGTTGRPKTIAGSNFFYHVGCHAKVQYAPYSEDDNRLAVNVMFVWEVLSPLLFGHQSFLIPDEAVLDPNLFVSTLQQHKCSRVLTTPSLLATVMQYCARDLDGRLASMRSWFMCGEVLPMTTVHSFRKALPRCRLINDYSTWESGDVSYATVSPTPAYEPSMVFAAAGNIASGAIVAIVDPETSVTVPRGVPGELYIGGSATSYGYYGQPDVTAGKFKNGLNQEMREAWGGLWYKTGDSGRLVGNPPVLELRGRIDSTVKIRGFKVGIPVVEASLQEVSGVALCVVVPVYESPAVVDSLLCFLKPGDESSSFDELVQKVRKEGAQKIPRWMMPTYFRPLPEALSGGESRKIDRKKLGQLADLATLRAESQQQQQANASAQPESLEDQADDEAGVKGIVRRVWAKALNLNPQALDPEENFFDLGGHSTLATKIATELSEEYGLAVTVLDIYSNSTLGALTDFVASRGDGDSATGTPTMDARRVIRPPSAAAPGISVVGLAGRFPGAQDAATFWENLRKAAVSATFLSKDFLRNKGVPEDTLAHKDFVPCAYMIEDADKFDYQFFGLGRHEASIMDPQHRVFIEASWSALENAALAPKGGLSNTVVGVFAAAGIDGYLVHHLNGLPLKDTMDPQDVFLGEIGNEKDYIATRVAYLLDFTGPAMNVNSACSSALVACAQAGYAIAANQCDAAVAGASSITFPNLGYLYQDGLVSSMDGYVKPFDASADGTVFGDAVASLILRRSDDCGQGLVWGSLRGFAVTNDGGQKAGYAAPSPVGQSMAIMGAMQMMGEDPWSLSYVEAHCTGTRVGDGIEVRGLLDAFQQVGGKKGPGEAHVALGSVKGNIAHANCAAGATGLIKVLQMLQAQQLVPTANFTKLNPKINLEGTPFFVNNELCSWSANGRPLRAGVSSFGIGGTNAHTVLEEPSVDTLASAEATPLEEAAPRWAFHVLPLSAKTPTALRATAERFADGLQQDSVQSQTVGSAAYTLQTGRTFLPLRKALVVPAEAGGDLAKLSDVVRNNFPSVDELEDLEDAPKKPTVAFVFPGQGSQYLGMARGLYEQVPVFRRSADRCCELLAAPELLGFDLRKLLFSPTLDEEEFSRPTVTQPSLFVVEYSLAQVFLAVGVSPVATAGHSLGEYAASVVGGLLTLESATAIVAARAKSTETLAEDGAMLSVAGWTEQDLKSIERGDRPGLWLAGVNSPVHAVISGEKAAVAELETELKEAGRKCTRLHVKKAFHSGLVAKAADTLDGLGMPAESSEVAVLPVASNFTGGWLSKMQLKDGSYWTKHMRGTVRWRDNAEKILKQWQPTIVVEVGPGNALSMLTVKCVADGDVAPSFIQAMRHPKAKNVHDVEALMGSLGRLWEVGYAVDWKALHTDVLGESASLPAPMRLPAYAFDKSSLWVNPERSVYVDVTEDPAPASCIGKPTEQVSATGSSGTITPLAKKTLVRFGDQRSREPAIKAYCLPFACGSTTVFAPWAAEVDDAVEIIALELPGRGGRSEEKVPGSDAEDEALFEALCDMILADLGGAQYVLVGFSMGGGMCMELALRIQKRQAMMPLAVYIAGRRPPALDPASILDIDMTNEELADYAFAPPEVARSAEFAEHVVPLLRADLGLDARTERRLSAASKAGSGLPAGVGVQVFCGVTDGIAPFVDAPGWQRFAAETVGVHYYPGGHEFMQEQRPALRAAWRREAVGRLVQRRSVEVALLAAQGYAAPSPMLFGGALAPAPPAPAVKETKQLPLYAVQWVPIATSEKKAAVSSTFFVNLGTEVSESALDAAVVAMQGGATIVAACEMTAGVLSGQPMDVEVEQSWQFVRLVQRLLEVGVTGQLVVVCPAAGSGAMVAGASKAVAMEAGELKIKRIFVPLACLDFAQERAASFCALAGRHPDETDLWVQDKALQGFAYAPRLERMVEPSAKLLCVPRQRPDGSLAKYVLTGATGGLGKSVVEWLIDAQGLHPEQLVLLRRAGSTPLTGVLAKCLAVEIADTNSTDAMISSSLRTLRGISGIMHLAGVLDDGIINGMTRERMQKVAQPKCGMLTALLRAGAALQWPLRWAVGFSSTSSLFGYAGQANYCAANAMLDQLATFGSAGVLPQGDQPPCKVLAINWGPWAEAGMAKVGTKAYEQAVKEGDTPLSNAAALGCLAAALRVAEQAQPSAVQFCACDVEWEKSQWRDLPILDLVFEKKPVEPTTTTTKEDKEVKEDEKSPQSVVESFMLQHTKSGGSWKKIQGKSLHQLGLDSLETVQLRNLFNKKFGVNAPLGVFADVSLKLNELSEALSKYITKA